LAAGWQCFGYALALSNRAYLPQEFLRPLKLNSVCGKKIEYAKGLPLQFSAKLHTLKKYKTRKPLQLQGLRVILCSGVRKICRIRQAAAKRLSAE